MRTVYSDGTTDYFSGEQLQRKELACGEIYHYSILPPPSAAAQRLAPPPPIVERVEFADTYPSHGVMHKFEGRLRVTTYDDCHRFAGFTDTYHFSGTPVEALLQVWHCKT